MGKQVSRGGQCQKRLPCRNPQQATTNTTTFPVCDAHMASLDVGYFIPPGQDKTGDLSGMQCNGQ
jgi:hypothetical protein